MMEEKRKIVIPSHCPSCSSLLENVNGQLFCRNDDCPAKTSKILVHFAKALQIKGLGPKTIEKLNFNSFADLYDASELYYTQTLGPTLGSKLYREVQESKSADLEKVLVAFGIYSIGETASKRICSVVNHISEITEETCAKANLGNSHTEKLLTWLENNQRIIKSLPFSYESNSVVANNNDVKSRGTVCITGKLNNFSSRKEAKAFLESNGFTVVDTITSQVIALICEDGSESAKTEKAKAKNIPILTIESLIKREI